LERLDAPGGAIAVVDQQRIVDRRYREPAGGALRAQPDHELGVLREVHALVVAARGPKDLSADQKRPRQVGAAGGGKERPEGPGAPHRHSLWSWSDLADQGPAADQPGALVHPLREALEP